MFSSALSTSGHASEVVWLDPQGPSAVKGPGSELRLGTNRFVYELMPQVAAITAQGFERAGLKVALMDLPPERSLLYASQGVLDGELWRGHFDSSEHASLIKVDVPLATLFFYPYVRLQQACMEQPEQLKDRSSIGIHGLHYFKLLKEMGIHYAHEAPNTVSGLKMLAAGRADFIVLPDYVVPALEKATEVKVKRCLEEPILSIQLFTFLHERHRTLIPVLEKAYREILSEGKP
jgi:polar amino acid transport system substrate-binding protein